MYANWTGCVTEESRGGRGERGGGGGGEKIMNLRERGGGGMNLRGGGYESEGGGGGGMNLSEKSHNKNTGRVQKAEGLRKPINSVRVLSSKDDQFS